MQGVYGRSSNREKTEISVQYLTCLSNLQNAGYIPYYSQYDPIFDLLSAACQSCTNLDRNEFVIRLALFQA